MAYRVELYENAPAYQPVRFLSVMKQQLAKGVGLESRRKSTRRNPDIPMIGSPIAGWLLFFSSMQAVAIICPQIKTR
jgi:hypothetical protein